MAKLKLSDETVTTANGLVLDAAAANGRGWVSDCYDSQRMYVNAVPTNGVAESLSSRQHRLVI